MRRITLFMSLLLMTLTAAADQGRRPMLAQGKTWYYNYHHFEDKENPTGDNYPDDLYKETLHNVTYTLKGDTVIDNRTYMKMYRSYDWGMEKYFGAFREDEDGKVYAYNYQGDNQDYLLIDFSLQQYDDGWYENVAPIASTIKVNGQAYRRYKYQKTRPDGSTYMLGLVGVEGVGFQGFGLVIDMFAPVPDCICDYESFNCVFDEKGSVFYVSDFLRPNEIELSDNERQLVENNNDFAFDLFEKANTGDDLILSPLSITYALGMLNNGAARQTQQEITQVLGGDSEASPLNDQGEMINDKCGVDAINEFCRKLLDEVGGLDEQTRVSIANTIYMNQPYVLKPEFVQKANDYYDAQPETRDFHDGQTMDVINQWASDHTEGMIQEVLDEQSFDPDALSYLLNAIYFKGTWTDKFDKSMTLDEPFNGGADVPMMHRHDDIVYTDNDVYQAVRLPYGNEAYQMCIFLPRENKTTADVLAALKDGNGQWQLNNHPKEVDLKLPRFETETNQNLKTIMSDLGMPTAFDPFYADFSGFCDMETYISAMRQVAKIKLDEEGTEAAAVTIIEVTAGSAFEPDIKEFHANRPFLYIIFEQSTGVIFFIGQYTGSQGSRTPDGISDAPRLNENEKMRNGENEKGVYDLQGRRISASLNDKGQMTNEKLKRGVYIENGRKIVVR